MWQPRKSDPARDAGKPRAWNKARAALFVLQAIVAALKGDEALALVTRALIWVGDLIVEAGKHTRS
ncbi:hypothetical protein [Amycolatopsis sp. NPDC059657]|uniref:hypothetical protein n=1 Tax=Amycolatopsis sp. NPDC059657 TaxID=3346899 RepID=UPI00366B0101